ncbi:MAG TPA: endonuclease/exonuclease/phosphatase family protein [Rhodothermales bacterium]|nr:endonuclease/exonuclease/phosphatase family protein [Rhodothermales bacterium]
MRKLFWTLFLVCDLLLVAAFLLGYSAWYVPPATLWWPGLFALVLPYLSLAVVLALVFVLATRRWILVALHTVLLVLILIRFAPVRAVAGALQPEPGDFRIMTFNLPGPDLVGATAAARANALEALVDVEEPDLIGLQEIHLYMTPKKLGLSDHIRVISREKGYTYARPAHITRTVLIPQPVAGKVAFGPLELIPLHHTVPAVEKVSVVRTPFTWQGRGAVHYNVHLQSYHAPDSDTKDVGSITPRAWLRRLAGSKQAFMARAQEAEQIHRMISREKLPVIISGDFNDIPHSWAYHRIAQGMTDTFKAAGSGWGATWHARIPLFRIDFILASPEWEIVSAHVPDVVLSDHRPLVARLRWRE